MEPPAEAFPFTVAADTVDADRIRLADTLYPQLAKHEGIRPKVYNDSTGKPTIGIGFNLADPANRRVVEAAGLRHEDLVSGKRSLSDKEIRSLYNHSLNTAMRDAEAWVPNLRSHPPEVQRAVIDMAFNLGRTRLMGFKKTRKALEARDYNTAANEMLDSKWAKQVKGRATTLSEMVRTAKP
jgi:lysozyme